MGWECPPPIPSLFQQQSLGFLFLLHCLRRVWLTFLYNRWTWIKRKESRFVSAFFSKKSLPNVWSLRVKHVAGGCRKNEINSPLPALFLFLPTCHACQKTTWKSENNGSARRGPPRIVWPDISFPVTECLSSMNVFWGTCPPCLREVLCPSSSSVQRATLEYRNHYQEERSEWATTTIGAQKKEGEGEERS